jgi:hypothetical protein
MRSIVGGGTVSGVWASPSQIGCFETRWLTQAKNLSAARHGFERQPHSWRAGMSVWNGYCTCTCYHPLFAFS